MMIDAKYNNGSDNDNKQLISKNYNSLFEIQTNS